MKVYLVGIGMGNPDTATAAARRAIEGADLLIGGQRMLDAFPEAGGARLALTRADDIVAALEQVRDGRLAGEAAVEGAAGECRPERACVLLSGDVGFYSGAALLYDRLGSFDVEAVPGVSSLSYLCAKVRTPYSDTFTVSAHGRAANVAGAVQCRKKTFAITGGAVHVQDICADLVERGLGGLRAVAGERLSYPDERIVDATAADLAQQRFDDLAVLLVFNDRPVERPFVAPSIADEEFTRAKVPMTKEEVRAVVVSKLRIAADSVVWDVGAGTGSVSVEAALAARAGRVFAIERNVEACALIRWNAECFNAANLAVVEGEAPGALMGLPAPDRVFVGGAGGNLEGILREALSANPHVRIVLTAVTLETLSEALRVFAALGLPADDIVQLSVARAQETGAYHLMRAQNPVYVIAGAAKGDYDGEQR